MKTTLRFSIAQGITVLVLATMACALPANQSQNPPGFEQTSIALGVQQTSVAQEKATLQARETEQAAATSTQAPPAASDTPAPLPTDTLAPSATLPPPTATIELPSATPTSVDMEALIKGANILVYEDMAGNYDRKALVHQAVSEMDFSGGKVIEVGDALGNFKSQLLSPTQWDLIIVAAEYRSSVQGEFWKYVYDRLNHKVALAIEVWYLDQHYTDIQPIFSECGISYQKNWERGNKYDPLNYSIYWLQPDHPFFQPPQDAVSLTNPSYLYWVPPRTTDAGDLIQLESSGDAVLLGGTQPGTKSRYGVLATCMQGTVMVQTFSTHDYADYEVVKLWKNYMRYTLTNHFLQKK